MLSLVLVLSYRVFHSIPVFYFLFQPLLDFFSRQVLLQFVDRLCSCSLVVYLEKISRLGPRGIFVSCHGHTVFIDNSPHASSLFFESFSNCQCQFVFRVILILQRLPKQRTVHPEMTFLVTEKTPRAYLDDQATVKLMFLRLIQFLFLWCVSQAFHALLVCRSIRHMMIC